MGYKIKLNHQIGTTTYETKEEAERIAEYIKKTFKDLHVRVVEI